MGRYRFCHFGPEGREIASESFEADDDVDAVRRARALPAEHGGELWMENRRITTLLPKRPPRHAGREKLRLFRPKDDEP